MIKKLMMLCVAAMTATGAWAEVYYDWYSNDDGNNTITLSGVYVDGVMPNPLVIPSEYKGNKVTRISLEESDIRKAKSIVLPNSLLAIEDNIFVDCMQLEKVDVVPGGKYKTRDNMLLSVDEKELVAVYGKASFSRTLLTIPDTVEVMGWWALFGSLKLKSVEIPKNVREIKGNPFVCCYALENISLHPANSAYKIENELLLTKDGKKLIATAGSYTKKRRDIVVPEGVEEICQLSLTSDMVDICNVWMPKTLKVLHDALEWGGNGGKNGEYGAMENVVFQSQEKFEIVAGACLFCDCDINNVWFAGPVPKNFYSEEWWECGNVRKIHYTAEYKDEWEEALRKIGYANRGQVNRLEEFPKRPSYISISKNENRGCGSVTGSGSYSSGSKIALKATPNKGYVFAGWEGPLDESQDPRNLSISYVVGEDDAEFVARFIPVEDDVAAISFTIPKEYENGVAIDNVSIDVSGCASLPTVKVTGLPSGLKFTAKDIFKKGSKTEVEYPANTIYGTPTKSGVYTIAATVTTAGKKTATYSQTVIVRKSGEKVVVAECDATGGKVTGGGVYAEGKSASLKATANKGYVFAGWYYSRTAGSAVDGVNAQAARSTGMIPCDSTLVDYRNPSYSYIMGAEDKTFYARFEPVAADTNLNLAVDGVAITSEDTPLKSLTVGSATNLPLVIDSLSLPKASVKGLPTGMKFTEKPIFVKGSKTEIETPANSIYGTPTKPGVYKVSVSLTNMSIKKAIVNNFEIVVPNLKDGMVTVEDEYGPYVPGVAYTNMIVVAADCAVSGLPAGMKWTAKDILDNKTKEVSVPANSAYGAPTTPGKYTVYFTKTVDKVKHTATATFIVGEFPVINVVTIGSGTGKVTGAGAFAANKKVTLKATADTKDDAKKGTKKSVFAGWYLDESCLSPVESTVDFRTASLPYVMTAEPETTLYALFVTTEEDSDIMLYVKDKEITANANDNNFVAEGTTILPLQMDSISIPKASLSGLPAGMKFTAKALTVKATKTEEAYDVPANAIYGTPTKPGVYTVTVKLTNTTIKKAIEKKFTIEVPNLTAADHLFREDGEYYIANDIGDKYSMYVGVTEFDLPKIRLNSNGTVKVSGLPSGLKYNAGTGAIEGVTSKAGNYTVSLTVGGLVSTFTIEIKPLPNWVIGTFEGWNFDEWGYDLDGMKLTVTISNQGKISTKQLSSDGNRIVTHNDMFQLSRFEHDAFVMEHKSRYLDEADDWVDDVIYLRISRSEVNGVEYGVLDGWYTGDDGWEPWEGEVFGAQNIWKKDVDFNFLPSLYNGAEMVIDMTSYSERTLDFNKRNYPVKGCSLRLKFGKNGAVTAAFYEPGASKATGTASATLMPYNRYGDTVEALLTIAIAPKGRHSITLALYLRIDTSRGLVYGDDIEIVNYLMEAE